MGMLSGFLKECRKKLRSSKKQEVLGAGATEDSTKDSTAEENKRQEANKAPAAAEKSVVLRDPFRPYTVTQAERELYQRLVLGMREEQIARADARRLGIYEVEIVMNERLHDADI